MEKGDKENLIDIRKVNDRIQLDLRYATSNNFTKKIVYTKALCFVHKDIASSLNEIQCELEKENLGLKIYDGYRPVAVNQLFWDLVQDERYVSPPGSINAGRHSRGTAVDVTMITKEGVELAMPTEFDAFIERAHSDFMDLPKEVLKNREKLHAVMAKWGFTALPTEWWHFDYKGYESYPLIDVTFEELLKATV